MKIEILQFIKDVKNKRQGYFDFKVEYSEEKWEIFRNASYFTSGDKKWVTLGACKRNDMWVPRYERSGTFNEVYKEATKALSTYLERTEKEDLNLLGLPSTE